MDTTSLNYHFAMKGWIEGAQKREEKSKITGGLHSPLGEVTFSLRNLLVV